MTTGALPPIPDKLFFKIGEVSALVGVKPHVLRFWEGEFSHIRPAKSGTGHRVYARNDVERLRQIRVLLHDRRFTIAGVRALLARGGTAVEAALSLQPVEAEPRPAAEHRIAELEAERDAARTTLQTARREADAARTEARFWREQARQARAVPSDRMARAHEQVTALRKWARGDVEG